MPLGRLLWCWYDEVWPSASWSTKNRRESPRPSTRSRGRTGVSETSPCGGSNLISSVAAQSSHISPPHSGATGGRQLEHPPWPRRISVGQLLMGWWRWQSFSSRSGRGIVWKCSDRRRFHYRPSQSSSDRWQDASQVLVRR